MTHFSLQQQYSTLGRRLEKIVTIEKQILKMQTSFPIDPTLHTLTFKSHDPSLAHLQSPVPRTLIEVVTLWTDHRKGKLSSTGS